MPRSRATRGRGAPTRRRRTRPSHRRARAEQDRALGRPRRECGGDGGHQHGGEPADPRAGRGLRVDRVCEQEGRRRGERRRREAGDADAADRPHGGEHAADDRERDAGVRGGVQPRRCRTGRSRARSRRRAAGARSATDATPSAVPGQSPCPQQPRDAEHEHARRGDDDRSHLEARDEVGDEEEHDGGDRDEHHPEREEEHLHARASLASSPRRPPGGAAPGSARPRPQWPAPRWTTGPAPRPGSTKRSSSGRRPEMPDRRRPGSPPPVPNRRDGGDGGSRGVRRASRCDRSRLASRLLLAHPRDESLPAELALVHRGRLAQEVGGRGNPERRARTRRSASTCRVLKQAGHLVVSTSWAGSAGQRALRARAVRGNRSVMRTLCHAHAAQRRTIHRPVRGPALGSASELTAGPLPGAVDFRGSIRAAACFGVPVRVNRRVESATRGVAQLGRAPALGAGGRRFESCRPDELPRLDTNFHTTGDLPHADHFG